MWNFDSIETTALKPTDDPGLAVFVSDRLAGVTFTKGNAVVAQPSEADTAPDDNRVVQYPVEDHGPEANMLAIDLLTRHHGSQWIQLSTDFSVDARIKPALPDKVKDLSGRVGHVVYSIHRTGDLHLAKVKCCGNSTLYKNDPSRLELAKTKLQETLRQDAEEKDYREELSTIHDLSFT